MREQSIASPALRGKTDHDRYEYLIITVEPGESLKEARARIGEHAEYGKWELSRSIILYGGRRRYWLRRRIMRVQRTTQFL
ncbi:MULTISPECIES: DUF5703 family protein [unclassified Rothia (in: high G+C Gram-positive bacteria)]|uniref:DUF5703 family protein n=1 Tax=unclassified Rothia (in: high G+C Gram-positive bacteria) TaxID=2689056 RepID=UPI00195C8F36|nr:MULTISPECIES: DUF5703 family protein [unclassified Rothia (in: high G+C Gram-positive bacteria)]MBM7050569.1 hypothetical protein [Rothia sp. ZJ1223]QRZ60761.1 hypothetical protein JR346_05555 [Rothia sp. ZJ932]